MDCRVSSKVFLVLVIGSTDSWAVKVKGDAMNLRLVLNIIIAIVQKV